MRKLLQLKLHWQVLIALALAVLVGTLTREFAGDYQPQLLAGYKFTGSLFINALKMLIVPLITASIITGVANIGKKASIGRLGGKTMLYYMATSLVAIFVGLLMVNLINPGVINGQLAKDVIHLPGDASQILQNAQVRQPADILNLFKDMIPANIFAAAADNGQLIGLIFFCLLFGFFMTRITAKYASTMKNLWQAIFEIMMRITSLVMKFTPIGVFALVAGIVTTSGPEVFKLLIWFILTVLAALLIHFLVVLPLVLRFIARVNPWRHYQAMAPALLTAFSTASSAATLPVTLECVEKNAGVSNKITSFTVPLGTTINMDGTALFECVAVIFIAQAYGVPLSFAAQFIIVFIALLTSIGVAAVPQASLVAIVVIMKKFDIPDEGIVLILAVDRFLDMCRTSVNVFSDSCGAVVIGRSEGEKKILLG